VLEVKSGHHITITYNLYVTEHIGGVIQRFPTADAALSPLYEGAKQMLEQPGFMKDGEISNAIIFKPLLTILQVVLSDSTAPINTPTLVTTAPEDSCPTSSRVLM
jgi:hypothetical protein